MLAQEIGTVLGTHERPEGLSRFASDLALFALVRHCLVSTLKVVR